MKDIEILAHKAARMLRFSADANISSLSRAEVAKANEISLIEARKKLGIHVEELSFSQRAIQQSFGGNRIDIEGFQKAIEELTKE